ncbi:GIY-YIG nuclease family protein [Bosea sp. (in: a-proteobacteria)]|uniref:GIY-YIG nuclease family protein n=1 Tax=Bosea sp. (in: a-proteobacteria) TaxID=1871050 RepID=UPI003B3B3D5D
MIAALETPEVFGRSIQLFLVDGSPNGLMIASIHGWTGSILLSNQSNFGRLLARHEVDRTGVYILYGPDPENPLKMRTYIGEADSVRERIAQSAGARAFWEHAVVITTSDEALTKGHVRYLEARLIEMAKAAGRVQLDNGQAPDAERRRLPEADRANMEAFLANLRVVLPTIGLDLLKPRPQLTQSSAGEVVTPSNSDVVFEIVHRSGVKASAIEVDDEFIVRSGSEARKDTQNVGRGYQGLKDELIAQGVLATSFDGSKFIFARDFGFSSPSAAAAVVLDRNANGRIEWKTADGRWTYHQWQERRSGLDPEQ